MRSRSAERDERFAERAREVFAGYKDCCEKADRDARMMWLAWLGDDRYLQVHRSNQAGRESAWQFCEYTEIPLLVERCKSVEARPLSAPFTDRIIAFLTVLVQRQVGESRGVRVYSLSTSADTLGFVETDIDVADTYDRIKDGYEVVADWKGQPEGVLKNKTISLSPERFVCLDYAHVGDKVPTSSRGFIYTFKRQDRAIARRRRQSAVKWVMSG